MRNNRGLLIVDNEKNRYEVTNINGKTKYYKNFKNANKNAKKEEAKIKMNYINSQREKELFEKVKNLIKRVEK